MTLRLDATAADFDARFAELLAMKREVSEDVDSAARGIIADVIARGDAALIDLSRKFDRIDLDRARVIQVFSAIHELADRITPRVRIERELSRCHRRCLIR